MGANIDLALVSVYLFIGFFVMLVFWLHRESKLEGYPLVPDIGESRGRTIGFPEPGPSKTFKLGNGESVTVSGGRPDTRALALKPMARHPGTAYIPTGHPMADGVGPASYAERADRPDLMEDGSVRIKPLRLAPAFHVAKDDPSPIGMKVIAGNNKVAGKVVELWIDRAEYLMRYMEVEVPVEKGTRRVLLPTNFAVVDGARKTVTVRSIFAEHFPTVPGTRSMDQVTLLEEDKIMGYYGGGTLYATRMRQEPLA
jgi:photosynthetic reaction center H subunit